MKLLRSSARTVLVRLGVALLLSLGLSAGAVAQEITEGKDYRVIAGAAANPSGKIEVVEFFSYACGHCNEFHPMLKRWAKALPADVELKRLAVRLGPSANLAKLFYALETMGELERLDDLVFVAVHQDGVRFEDNAALNEWLVKKGVNIDKFNAAFNGFSTSTSMNRAHQLANQYKIEGVPTLVVNGQYVITAYNHDQRLKVANALIAKIKANKGSVKK